MKERITPEQVREEARLGRAGPLRISIMSPSVLDELADQMEADAERITALKDEVASLLRLNARYTEADAEQKREVERLREALRPFAAMHRPGSDPDEMACSRGIASDATYLFSRDFERAHSILHPKESEGQTDG